MLSDIPGSGLKLSSQNHPLKVYFPQGGTFFLLHWWNYNERGHVVLSRNLKSLTKVADHIFTECEDCEIRSFCKIEIVSPPQKLIKEATEYFHKEDVRDWAQLVCHTLNSSAKTLKREELPKEFEWCKNIKSKERYHDCDNCTNGIRIKIDREELYQRYAEAWNIVRDKQYPPLGPKYVYSNAEQALDDEPIWIANPNLTKFDVGIELEEVKLCRNALFYFRKLENLNRKELQTMLDAHKEERKKIRQKVDEVREFLLGKEELEKATDIFNIFKE